jgi:hypothetical protein
MLNYYAVGIVNSGQTGSSGATCATSDQTCDSGYRVTATASDAQSLNFASTLQVLVFGRLRRH